ncbi:uncharacterized protein FIBRA_09021 [Fibroporia radiculosa]|uniref:Methyltransferase ausD n=1 Tax=Fibroporia radiculosa TaxID=599839 RepID=J4I3P3_9APHY|nr:uncharacterized protein FIBRA_09021 [Fibroporia radiculosa]CCM06727.1 predicted protein [Fibroporia radiculosa]
MAGSTTTTTTIAAVLETTKKETPVNVLEGGALDEQYYNLQEDELAFFKAQTGIQNEGELKRHIMKAQEDAYKSDVWSGVLRPYEAHFSTKGKGMSHHFDAMLTTLDPVCRSIHIRVSAALLSPSILKISRLPAYKQLLELGQKRAGAMFLDIGCCFGNDVRKAIVDGFPAHQALASDLKAEFWDLGHHLFNSTPSSFPVKFLPGDALDAAFLEPGPIFTSPPAEAAPALTTLETLSPLRGHVSAIHASSFFHLFDEPTQTALSRAVAGLLSPEPGSVIFGVHGGRPEKGLRIEQGAPNARGNYMFCHCPESWAALWDGEIFPKGTVRVEATLINVKRDMRGPVLPGTQFWALVWSVTRL